MTTSDEARLLVAGRLVAAADGATYPVTDPAAGELVGSVPDAGPLDLDRALGAARDALAGPTWRDPELRERCLRQLHDALAAAAPRTRALTTTTTGMPVALLGAEHDEPVERLGRLVGADDAEGAGRVRAVITPWTSPHAVGLDRVGRALLAGDAVVLKPAPANGWVACDLARLAVEHTDIPPGVLSVLPTRDVDVAIALTTDPRVDVVDLAGSPVVAERVRHQAASAGKQLDLEVGGAGRVVAEDADSLEQVVRQAAYDVALHAGQRTGAPTRLEVPRSRYDEAVEAAVTAMQEIVPGDPTDPATVCGPLGSAVQRDRVRRYLALAEHEGGRVVCGGGPVPGHDRGHWLQPAVVAGVDAGARVAREEILGPVIVVVPA